LNDHPGLCCDRIAHGPAEFADRGQILRGARGIAAVAECEIELPMACGIALQDRVHPQIVTRGQAVIGKGVEYAARLFDREHDAAGDRRPAELVRTEFERRDDAKVAAPALQCPEQVGIFLGVGAHQFSFRGHHLGADQAVDGEAELSLQPADTSAECEAGDPGVRNGAGRHHQPVGLGFTVQRT
jgi:hypothetical protein